MHERESDTTETFGKQDPPSGTSDQMPEEPSAPTGEGHSRPEPGADRGSRRDDTDTGDAEGRQATGHPDNAG